MGVVNWVRFVYLDRGPGWGWGKLGSFRIFGSADGGRGGKLGSFRVIGGWQDGGGAEIGFVSWK